MATPPSNLKILFSSCYKLKGLFRKKLVAIQPTPVSHSLDHPSHGGDWHFLEYLCFGGRLKSKRLRASNPLHGRGGRGGWLIRRMHHAPRPGWVAENLSPQKKSPPLPGRDLKY